MLGDLNIASRSVSLGFAAAGDRADDRQTLPRDFSAASFLIEKGMLDLVVIAGR